jgi:hypothetical protein
MAAYAPWILFLFGVGFLVANIRLGADLLRYYRRKRSALLTWRLPRPRFYWFNIALAVLLALLLGYKLLIQRRDLADGFGEAMMLLYYGYAFPMTTRIARGFYQDGVWAETGFMPWGQISAVSWREDPSLTLVLVSHLRSIARRLEVPGPLYGQARRLLRDRIKAQDIHISGLDLGRKDEDSV